MPVAANVGSLHSFRRKRWDLVMPLFSLLRTMTAAGTGEYRGLHANRQTVGFMITPAIAAWRTDVTHYFRPIGFAPTALPRTWPDSPQ
jgi:hypothetical protein